MNTHPIQFRTVVCLKKALWGLLLYLVCGVATVSAVTPSNVICLLYEEGTTSGEISASPYYNYVADVVNSPPHGQDGLY